MVMLALMLPAIFWIASRLLQRQIIDPLLNLRGEAGAIAGGVIIGVTETLVAGYISSTYRDAIAFGILILILLVKPSGLLGKKEIEKV